MRRWLGQDRGRWPAQDGPIYSELADRKAVTLDGWKLHVDAESGAEELYRVNGESRSESEPADDPAVRARLRALLDPLLHAPAEAPGETLGIDAETQRRLRELGYLDGEETAPK